MSDQLPLSERRETPDHKERNRRVIERFSHPSLRDSLKQIHSMVTFLFYFVLVFGVAQQVIGAMKDKTRLFQSIFVSGVVLLLCYSLFQYAKSIPPYLNSESATNLANCSEKNRNLWITLMVLACIFGIVKIVAMI